MIGFYYFAIVFGVFLITIVHSYVVPEARIERLSPRGIRVSIPDEDGVQFFAFHANVNRPIRINDEGSITGEVLRSRNNNWTFHDRNIILRNDDVLHYWIYVQADGLPYTKIGDEHRLSDRLQESANSICHESITTVRGISECRDRVVFEENFDNDIDSTTPSSNSTWTREILMPMDPDYEFCIYRELTKNIDFDDGIMSISPLVLDDEYGLNATLFGRLDLAELCTGSKRAECSRKAVGHSILPPVISARLTTKQSFHFRYGKIEIRAKFPRGDWLYPEIRLEPKHRSEGVDDTSSRIILGLARGNRHLTSTTDSTDGPYGSKILEFGLQCGSSSNIQTNKVNTTSRFGSWNDDFHTYTTIWNEEGFRFQVDDEDVGELNPPSEGWLASSVDAFSRMANRRSVNQMAPFDTEFYITVGLGVGGVRVFPDRTMSGRHQKPWRNVGAKAMLQFWQSKRDWLPTWTDRNGVINSKFQIDYIKITSI